MADTQKVKFPAEVLYRAADSVWTERRERRFLGGLLKDALEGKKEPLTVDEVRTAVETVYRERFPEEATQGTLPSTAEDTITEAISELREELERQKQSENPL